MKLNIESTKKFLDYIKNNEVIYQVCDGLIEVSNAGNTENRNALTDFFKKAICIEAFQKNDVIIQESFADLNNWSTDDDTLLLLQDVGVLVCVPKKDVSDNNLMIA